MASRTRRLLVSVPEAARLLGVGTSLAWEMARDGRLPTIRLGRRRLVPLGVLADLAGLTPTEAAELLTGHR